MYVKQSIIEHEISILKEKMKKGRKQKNLVK